MQKARDKKAMDEVSVTSAPSDEEDGDEDEDEDEEDEEETEADLMEDVADELQSAQEAWAKVCGAGVFEREVSAAALSAGGGSGGDGDGNGDGDGDNKI